MRRTSRISREELVESLREFPKGELDIIKPQRDPRTGWFYIIDDRGCLTYLDMENVLPEEVIHWRSR